MDQPLLPIPRVWLRALLFAGILLPVVFLSTHSWSLKLPSLLMWAALIGSYRDARIAGPVFRFNYVIAFVPLPAKKLKLDRVARLGVDIEESLSFGWILVFGFWNVLFTWLLDWLLPWVGGRYRVWLVTIKGKKILAWQGNSDPAFDENVRRLEAATGLTMERTGFSP